MDASQIWSWILSAIGLVGFFLAGKKVWWAWYVNIANQVIWTLYSFATEQWGFLVATAFYFYIFSRNAYLWTKEHFAMEDARKYFTPAEQAQQPVTNRVELKVRKAGAIPNPPSNKKGNETHYEEKN